MLKNTKTAKSKRLYLRKLMGIEEKLGFSLITLFKRKTCFAIIDGKIRSYEFQFLKDKWVTYSKIFIVDKRGICIDLFYLDEYRKTWSFKKEDLLSKVGDSND